DGETISGITIMQMDAGIDTGDILLKSEVAIAPDDTGGTLHDKLCEIAPKALIDTLVQIEQGTAEHTPQSHADATHAPMLTKEMARINFAQPTEKVINTIRAYNPFPGAFAEIDGKMLKVWRAAKACGEPRFCPKEGIFVATSDGIIHLLEITPPNGKKMLSADYVRGIK
ncbi:MAG: methionyl-tRNA formyltransferase, partial [Defluviitaleaceae bacterium]|nr:methionyl-tRNA formyltransferase [Defluviitaleaceae bacterium]